MALATMPHFGGRLGDTLVGLGLMKPLEVFRHLTEQVQDKLVDICSWSKGNFTWHEGVENPKQAFPLDLSAYQVLGVGAMKVPEAIIDAWTEEFAQRKPRATDSSHFPIESFCLGSAGAVILSSLDGTKTLKDIVSEDDTQKLARLLYLFAETEFVSFE